MANLTVAQAKVAITSATDAQVEAACKARGYTIGSPAQNRSKLQFALDRMKPETDSKIDEKDFPPIIVIKPSTKKRKSAHKPTPKPPTDEEEKVDEDRVAEAAKKVVAKAKKLSDYSERWWETVIEVAAAIISVLIVGLSSEPLIKVFGFTTFALNLVTIFAPLIKRETKKGDRDES